MTEFCDLNCISRQTGQLTSAAAVLYTLVSEIEVIATDGANAFRLRIRIAHFPVEVPAHRNNFKDGE